MSCYETHRGILKKVDCLFDEPRVFLSKRYDDFDYEGLTLSDVVCELDLQDKYVVIDNALYEWVEHDIKYDEEEDFCELTENSDGTISVHAQFYNGGTCIDEMIENNRFRIKKSKNAELTADQMIDVTCKWLDYHHSNYIVHMQYSALVAGACQTDLRDFLSRVKNMEYWDAIDAAKS